jgi:sulfotransferase family protein
MTNAEPSEPRATGRRRTRPVSNAPPVVFVGGTGRSGTHVLSRLLSRHPRLFMIPVEVRFHVEQEGFPGLLDGSVSKRDFVRRMRGFWWRGFQTGRMRGMFRFVPQERLDDALDAFEADFDDNPDGACRQLFYDLLWFRTSEADPAGAGPLGLVEQSTGTIAAAPTLARLFPEAKFIHVVRDGRDASASRVAQTRGLISPRTRRQGLEWWENRIRRIEAGEDAIAPDRRLTVSLDELLLVPTRPALRPLCRFLDVYVQRRMRAYFQREMSAERANTERWRHGLSPRRADELERAYEEVVARLEADGMRCAPLVRRTFERSRDPDAAGMTPLPFVIGDEPPLAPWATRAADVAEGGP